MSRAFDVATRLLEVARTGLDTAGRPVPARVCVQPGSDPAWDCEQLTAAVVRPSVPGTTTREAAVGRPVPWPTVVEVRVELVRCVPVGGDDGSAPPVAEWQQAAADLLDDAEALYGVLVESARVTQRGRPVLVQPVQLFGPSGGMVSVAVNVTLPL